jgi:F0F1-type ATP synthase assembly protein I
MKCYISWHKNANMHSAPLERANMARKSSKGESTLIALLLIVGIPIWLVSKVVESVGWVTPVVLIVGFIVAVAMYKRKKHNDRVRYLMDKYNNQEVVDRIIGGYFWQGQTEEQLIDQLVIRPQRTTKC